MNPDDYAGTTATELRDLIASGSLTCLEVAEAACDRIGRLNPDINAYVCFDRETVLKDAAELDRRQASGAPLGPLHGVPFAVKCLTEVAGLPHTHALVPFADNVGEKDATVVARLRAAGGLFTGLTNAPECGYLKLLICIIKNTGIFTGPILNPGGPGARSSPSFDRRPGPGGLGSMVLRRSAQRGYIR